MEENAEKTNPDYLPKGGKIILVFCFLLGLLFFLPNLSSLSEFNDVTFKNFHQSLNYLFYLSNLVAPLLMIVGAAMMLQDPAKGKGPLFAGCAYLFVVFFCTFISAISRPHSLFWGIDAVGMIIISFALLCFIFLGSVVVWLFIHNFRFNAASGKFLRVAILTFAWAALAAATIFFRRF